MIPILRSHQVSVSNAEMCGAKRHNCGARGCEQSFPTSCWIGVGGTKARVIINSSSRGEGSRRGIN